MGTHDKIQPRLSLGECVCVNMLSTRKSQLKIILKITLCCNTPLQVAEPGWNRAGEWHLDGDEAGDVCKARSGLQK